MKNEHDVNDHFRVEHATKYWRRGPVFWTEAARCVYAGVCVCWACTLQPPTLKKVNGRLIRKLGSLHASLPSHYSSLIGGRLPKSEHNMTGFRGCIWEGWSPWQKYVLHNKLQDGVVGLTCRSLRPSQLGGMLRVQWTVRILTETVCFLKKGTSTCIVGILQIWLSKD